MEIESLFFFFISKIHPKPAVYFESLRKTERVYPAYFYRRDFLISSTAPIFGTPHKIILRRVLAYCRFWEDFIF